MSEQLAPPRTQRRFANGWAELDYLCKKVHYWLYARKQRAIAKRRFRERLDRVVKSLPKNKIAIIRDEGLALLYELEGKFAKAIVHRQREIALMQRLHKEAQSSRYTDSTKAYLLNERDTADLKERQAILEALVLDHLTPGA